MEGDLTVRNSVKDAEQQSTSSAHCFEETKGPGQFGLLDRSSCLTLLGISLVAPQVPTASAKSICQAFNNIGKTFDLIGLVSAFGTAATTKSLTYSTLNDDPLYITGHVGPGGLNVAAALYQATGLRIGRLLAFGGKGEDTTNPAKLEPGEGLRYLGLKSNTECPVQNVVGEAIVRKHEDLWRQGRTQNPGEVVGRNAGRHIKVIVLGMDHVSAERADSVSLKANIWITLFLGWLPLALTISVIVSCCFCHLWFVAALLLFGTLTMTVAVSGFRQFCHFTYSKPTVAQDSPPGDILIVDEKEPEVFHIVRANEYTIQKLFQRKVVFVESFTGKYLSFVTATMFYIYVLASVLYMSNVNTSAQIHFAIATVIGLIADMAKASRNGKLGLARKACEKFKIVRRREVIFGNRTAAVAFVASHATDPRILMSKKLLPSDGADWQAWWEELAARIAPQLVGNGPPATQNGPEGYVVVQVERSSLLNTLLSDMEDGFAQFAMSDKEAGLEQLGKVQRVTWWKPQGKQPNSSNNRVTVEHDVGV